MTHLGICQAKREPESDVDAPIRITGKRLCQFHRKSRHLRNTLAPCLAKPSVTRLDLKSVRKFYSVCGSV